MRGKWAMERVTPSLPRSLIWSLVGREQLHRSRDRVQRERKNLLSCPADTFKSYQSKEGAWKESRVTGEGAAIRPDWHDEGSTSKMPSQTYTSTRMAEKVKFGWSAKPRRRTAESKMFSERVECGNNFRQLEPQLLHRANDRNSACTDMWVIFL